jgi:meiotically up-regulated gene 157 (Mug157) protein
MTIRKRGTRYYYDFMIRRQRYRGAIPEARTKAEAEQAETKIKNKVYERKYGKISASRPFAEFVRGTYLPWARANKRSRKDDEFHAKVFCRHFGNRSLSESIIR